MEVVDRIKRTAILPVVVIENAQDAIPAALALLKGGIDVMGITLRTACAEESIRLVTKEFPEMLVGVGSVIRVSQFDQALQAGAQSMVSPGIDEQLLLLASQRRVSIFSGVATPSEIMLGLLYGISVFKLFLAGILGGIKAIHALSAPFSEIVFYSHGRYKN